MGQWPSIALLLVVVTLLVFGVADADKESLSRPEWSIGDWWEFTEAANTWRLTVVARENIHYVLARSRRGQTVEDGRNRTTYHADLDGWITKTIAPDGKVTDSGDKREWVKFPMDVGTQWFFSVLSPVVGGPPGQLRMLDYQGRVVGWESIAVGDRSVRALKISYIQRLRGGSFGDGITGWYAPQAKRLVRLMPHYAGGPVVEVIAFGIQGDGTTAISTPSDVPVPRPTAVEFRGLPGAVIWIASQQYRLGDNGVATVTLPPGNHEMTVTRDGYEAWRSTVVIDGRQARVPYTFHMTPLTPPTITVREPRAGQVFRDASGRLRAEVVSPYRIASLTTSHSGATSRVVTPPPEQPVGRTWDVDVEVSLAEGDNNIDLEVRDEHGGNARQTVTLRRETPRPPHVSEPAMPLRQQAKPPLVVLNYPAADLKIERDRIVVVGLVTAEAGIATLQVTVNGAVVTPAGEMKPGSRGTAVRATVSLIPGDNLIEVTATDTTGSIAQVVRTVTRIGATAATGTDVAAWSTRRFAVVIGVGRYENEKIPRLLYSVPDAEAIYRTLVGVAGFRKEHVLLLTDKTERKPTLRNIKWALGTFLTRLARKDDTVLIFFAGHGAPEVDPRGFERDGLAKYLIPSDADPDDLYATALPMDELHTIFSRLESERIVALLDACYSGAAGGRTFAAKRTRASGIDDVFLDRLTRSKGRVIITASRSTEVSIELPELGHGLFTYHLVQALGGAADLNQDGIVSLQELYEYVEQQVSQKSRAVGANQHPVMKGEMEGIMPLTRVRKP